MADSALCLAIAELKWQRQMLVVAPSSSAAGEIWQALQFFTPLHERNRLVLFGDYETLPYDVFSPPQDIISERLHALYRAASGEAVIIVTSMQNLMHRLPPVEHILDNSLMLEVGQRLKSEVFRNSLVERGYRAVDTVSTHGEIAVRGSLIDLYPMGMETPCRIDLFDDEIESIRLFDPDTQLTLEKVDAIRVLPGREFPLHTQASLDFRNRWYRAFDTDARKSPVYESVARGFSPQGIESYLPLFFDSTAILTQYLRSDAQILLLPELTSTAERYWAQIGERFQQYSGNLERPVLRPVELFQPVADVFASINQFCRIVVQHRDGDKNIVHPLPDVTLHYRAEHPAAGLKTLIADTGRVLLCSESAGRREVLLETLGSFELRPAVFDSWESFRADDASLGICIGQIPTGWRSSEGALAIVAEADLFAEKVTQRGVNRDRRPGNWAAAEQVIRDLTELRAGAPVVHIQHGIGRFLGLETLKAGGIVGEFLALEYADHNKLYVPVDALNQICRYTGADSDSAPLHRLGSDQWEKAKRKAREQIRDTAAELLEIYARRQASQGSSYRPDEGDYQRFCQEFPFEETDDQLTAIAAVEADMASKRPMDRLVCGDVGFGKTEIAMRAAFIATSAGKQVVVLVPTTLLARQHEQTFRDRFANWPVRIDSVSRLRTDAEQEATLEEFRQGKMDILIGTHKLLHYPLGSERLGLLVVDEEHRFGVRQKDTLKAYKAEVDILTLTATPIPRTLNMAMAAIRDLSILATPPARRLAIKTFVQVSENRVLQEAIERELLRGGQIYLVHNEIRSIQRRAEEIGELIPDARVGVAHGQMRESELERIMGDFYHQRFDILVCTTIIETGIDIPTANTIIIDRADKFGLAQLHQLRGRVGRSHHQAYAFLLVPDRANITPDAQKRLLAIEEADHLGSGFALATHDLEIRGAGELLGDDQSGQIQAIGFELYQQMLERAVRDLQRADRPAQNLADQVEIKLNVAALIPDDYLPDINARLQLYRRISAAADEEALRRLQVEMIDRFGLLPMPVNHLFALAKLKLMAQPLGVTKIDIGERSGSISFVEQPPIDPLTLILLVQQQPQTYRFGGPSRLQFSGTFDSMESRVGFIGALLENLMQGTKA